MRGHKQEQTQPNTSKISPVSPGFIQTSQVETRDPAIELRAGLLSNTAQIPAWYFYGEIGSKLFEALTLLPDYYPTRTEALILKEHMGSMADATDVEGGTIIDLGAGSCDKAPKLFPTVRPSQYVPVDISAEYLRGTVTRLQREHPTIEMIGVGTDFSRHLLLPESIQKERRLFFYPGSSIGNFTPDNAVEFLRQVRSQMSAKGALWIGIDLLKDKRILERAYDDEVGATAAFNRNILRNVNMIAGTDFQPRNWQHVALFNDQLGRIEMHLEAREAMTVTWPDGERTFDSGERIHTENSYKYTPEGFQALLAQADLKSVGVWTDPKEWFAVFSVIAA
jgi:dimethylhistidine N-methyltransferase